MNDEQLEEELKMRNMEIAKSRDRIAVLQTKVEEWVNRNHDLTGALAAKDTLLNNAELLAENRLEEIEGKDMTISNMKNDLQSLKTQMGELEESSKAIKDDFEKCETAKKECENQILTMQTKAEEYQTMLKNVEQLLKDEERRHKETEERLNKEITNATSRLTTKQMELKGDLDTTRSEYNALKKTNALKEQEHSHFKANAQLHEDNIKQKYEAQLQERENEFELKEKQWEAIKSELLLQTKSIKEKETELSQVQNELKSSIEELENARSSIQEKEEKWKSATDQYNDICTQLKQQASAHEQALREQEDQLRKDAQQNFQKADDEAKTYEAHLIRSQEENATMRENEMGLRSQVDIVEMDLAKTKAELAMQLQQLEELQGWSPTSGSN